MLQIIPIMHQKYKTEILFKKKKLYTSTILKKAGQIYTRIEASMYKNRAKIHTLGQSD